MEMLMLFMSFPPSLSSWEAEMMFTGPCKAPFFSTGALWEGKNMLGNSNQAGWEALRCRACPLQGSLGWVTCKPDFNVHQQKKRSRKRAVLKGAKYLFVRTDILAQLPARILFVSWWFILNQSRPSPHPPFFKFGT